MMQNGYKLTLATINGTVPETYFLQKNDKAMDQNGRDVNIIYLIQNQTRWNKEDEIASLIVTGNRMNPFNVSWSHYTLSSVITYIVYM